MKKYQAAIILVAVMAIFANLAFAQSDSKQVSVSLINHDPDPAIAGEVVELRIGVENMGGLQVEDFKLKIDPEYPFSLVTAGDATQTIGTLAAYQAGNSMKILKYKLLVNKDASAGEYGIRFIGTEKGIERFDKTINVQVENKKSAVIVYVDQTALLPGNQTAMKFTISNVGSSTLRDLTFNWQNEDGIILPVGSDDTRYVKYVNPGESIGLMYNVMASLNAEPDLYKLKLTLTYDDPLSGAEKVMTTTAGIYVGGETDFDVTYSGSSKGETSFTISNVGGVKASSVTVTVPKQDGWRITGTNSAIIGNLNKGDYTVASFMLSSSNGLGAGTYPRRSADNGDATSSDQAQIKQSQPVQVEISYTDTMGMRKSVTKEITVDLAAMRAAAAATPTTATGTSGFSRAQPGNTTSWTTWIIIAAAVLVLGYFVYGHYKKRKMARPDYTLLKMIKEPLSKLKRK
ncbi:MAG: COG1361 S-layer family protein [Candidatus Woesearchaeota archaeon]